MAQGWSSEAADGRKNRARYGGALCSARARARVPGRGSPRFTRQREESAERQGCRGRLRIGRWLQARRQADEQEADRGGAAGSADHYLQSPIGANLLGGERWLSAGKECASGAASGAPRNEAGTDGGALSVDG